MLKTSKTVFWGFLTTDYKAMIELLEDMARKGWMLEKIGHFTAKFKAIAPQKITYYVDIFSGSSVLDFDANDDPRLLEYRKLCEESGWTFVTSRGLLQFFCAPEDVHAVPIQTDIEIENNIIKNTLLRSEYLGIALFSFLIIYYLFIAKFNYHNLLTFTGVAGAFLAPSLIILMLTWSIYIIIWNLTLRKSAKNGQPIPVPSLKSAKIRGTSFYLIFFILFIIMLIAFLSDAMTGSPLIVLISLTPPLLGLIIGIFSKKHLKASHETRKNKLVIFVLVLLASAAIVPIITIGLLSGFMSSGNEKIETVPKGYAVLKLTDFPQYEQADIERSRFDKKASPVVPHQFDYYEVDENHLSIHSKYYRALNPYFAKIIFDGKVAEMTRYFEIIPLSPSEWDADEVSYINNSNWALILKDNVVVCVDGDFDLSNSEIRDVVISNLLQ